MNKFMSGFNQSLATPLRDDATKRMPQMSVQLSQLQKECARLQEVCHQLCERLEVVSVPDSPQQPCEPCEKLPELLPALCQEVGCRTGEVSRVADRLENAFRRLEI